jgi:hypothetical protein
MSLDRLSRARSFWLGLGRDRHAWLLPSAASPHTKEKSRYLERSAPGKSLR